MHGDTLTSPGSTCRPPAVSLGPSVIATYPVPRVDLVRRDRATHAGLGPRLCPPLGAATVFLSHDDYEIDWASCAFVAVDEAYAGDYRGALVVDLGAHKGYYGAYALAHGARASSRTSPRRANFALPRARGRDGSGDRGGTWRHEQLAVGAERGEAELHVMGASWGHALHPPEACAEHEVGVEHVRVDALADVLSHAAESAQAGRA